jgi:outer membrane protein TolC
MYYGLMRNYLVFFLLTPCLSHGASLNDFLWVIGELHPRIVAATESANSSAYLTDAARGAWLPQVTANVQAGSNHSALYSGSNNSVRPGVTASQLVFDGGKTSNSIKAREEDTAAAIAQHNELKLTLTSRLAETYLEWHRQTELQKLSNEQLLALGKIEKTVADIASFDKGRASELTLVKMRISQLANSQEARSLAIRDVAMQLQQICSCTLVPTEAPPNLGKFLPVHEPDNVGDLLRAQHPAILGATARRNSANAEAEAAAAWWKPSVALQLSSQTEQDYFGKTRQFGLNSIGLSVSAPLFDGNTSNAREYAARARTRSSDADLTAGISELEAESHRLWMLVEQRKQRIATLKQLVQETNNTFDIVLEQFKLGRRNVIEVLSYENERFAARGQAISEEVDQDLARAKWLASIGKLNEKLETLK